MRIRLVSCLAVSVGLAFGLHAAEREAPQAGDLFDRHFAAIGGKDALTRLTNATVTGIVEEDGDTREFTLHVKYPGCLLLTTRSSSGKEVRIGRDSSARFWRQDSKGTHDLDGASAGELVGLTVPFNLAGLVATSEGLAEAICEADQSQGRPVFAIGRKRARGHYPRYLFDAGTGLLIGIRHARYADYRPIDGVKVPFTIKPSPRFTFRATSVCFDKLLPDTKFDRPGAKGNWLAQVSPPTIPVTSSSFVDQLSSPGKLEIVRRPSPARWGRGKVSTLPGYNPNSDAQGQVDVRGSDLRSLDLQDRLNELLHSDFDSRTIWPEHLPAGFEPARILELAKDPGLGVRAVHAQGITGKGIGLGIIDLTLLTEHREYADRLRLYEEIHMPPGSPAQMHGAAVASIAVGKTCGVAPDADLYHIAVQNSSPGAGGKTELDYTGVALAIHRLLDVNTNLPPERRIRVISISMGWGNESKGGVEATAAVERAQREGVFVISTSLRRTYQLAFDGLGREALANPNEFQSFGPGSWWAPRFWAGLMRFKPGQRLCVPMDARTTASPHGSEEFVYYSTGGWSWAVPWVAGLYALACQVKPDITPEVFWTEALRTGRTIQLQHDNETIEFGTIADPIALIASLQPSK